MKTLEILYKITIPDKKDEWNKSIIGLVDDKHQYIKTSNQIFLLLLYRNYKSEQKVGRSYILQVEANSNLASVYGIVYLQKKCFQ